MKPSLHCPSCSRLITTAHHPSHVTCAACRSRYGVVYGKLSRRSSLFETLFFFNSKLPKLYKRHYSLQITTPDRTLKQLQFSLPGKVDSLPVHYGDVVSVLYTMQGYMMKKLVAVTNHTTGKRHILATPVPSQGYLALLIGLVVIGLLVFAYMTGLNLFFTLFINILGIALYLKLTNMIWLTSPSLERSGRAGDRLLADQKLMLQRQRIDHRIDELNHECKSSQALIEQLEGLKQKMSALDKDLYSARIYRSNSAIAILKQQIANTHRLIREYQRAQRMVDIEVETSWVADQLPDGENFGRAIAHQLAELKEIEDQNQFLKLQLRAYEEVNLPGIPAYSDLQRYSDQ